MKSISLNNLKEAIEKYIEAHPEDKDKMIYFDGLHINGHIIKYNNKLSKNNLEILELQ